MADFATSEDLAARWRAFSSDDEEARATILLGDASSLIRGLSPSIDARITAEELDPNEPKAVVCAMVKRAMQGPADLDGVTQQSQSAGPFSQAVTFANPAGDLYLTKLERRRLGISLQRTGYVDLIPEEDEGS